MAVFISYSHEDAEFVDTLAAHLIKSDTRVWIDRWELHVGDSLIRRIEAAIENASAIVVVLSAASTKSEWCRKELTAGLVRELEEKRVLVLPIIVDDCHIPLFLRDKKHADFRKSFDTGLRDVRNAVARVTSDNLGRTVEPKWHTDWSTNWGVDTDGKVVMEILLVEQAEDQPYSVLTRVLVELNDLASARHLEITTAGAEPFARQLVLESVAAIPDIAELKVLIPDAEPVVKHLDARDPGAGLELSLRTECRRMGEDTGHDVLLNVGSQILQVVEHIRKALRPRTAEEVTSVLHIMKKYRPK